MVAYLSLERILISATKIDKVRLALVEGARIVEHPVASSSDPEVRSRTSIDRGGVVMGYLHTVITSKGRSCFAPHVEKKLKY